MDELFVFKHTRLYLLFAWENKTSDPGSAKIARQAIAEKSAMRAVNSILRKFIIGF